MKKTRSIAVIAATVLAVSLFCACGSGGKTDTTAAPQTTKAETVEKKSLKQRGLKKRGAQKESGAETGNFTYEGDYNLFAIQDVEKDVMLRSEDLGVAGSMTMKKGGTGTMTMDGDTESLKWEVSDDVVWITTESEETLYGILDSGFLCLFIGEDENTIFVFVQGNVDTSVLDIDGEIGG